MTSPNPELGGDFNFAAHIEAAFRPLWLIAAGMVKDPLSAEDVVQEAVVLAHPKIDQFQVGTSFTAWMSQFVRYVALNHVRKQNRQRTAPTDPVVMDQAAAAKTTAPPIRLTAQGQLPPDQMAFDDDLMAALNNVNDTARACLLLRTIDGMEYAEISKLLDIPAGTAMSHVHRSRQFLRKRLTAPSASPHKIHHPSTTPKRSPS